YTLLYTIFNLGANFINLFKLNYNLVYYELRLNSLAWVGLTKVTPQTDCNRLVWYGSCPTLPTLCLSNGLRRNIFVDANGGTLYSYLRDYCTMSDYRSPKYLHRLQFISGQHAKKLNSTHAHANLIPYLTNSGKQQEASADGTTAVTPSGASNTVTTGSWQ
ncbi:hypothetical protein AOQ84DRAFT_403630, partial [Glonium stellatum]